MVGYGYLTPLFTCEPTVFNLKFVNGNKSEILFFNLKIDR